MTNSHGDPDEKKPGGNPKENPATAKPWYKKNKNITTLIALAAMLVAIVSAGVSIAQANIAAEQNALAKQQNTAAEQQQLVNLVGAIAQDPATMYQQTKIFPANYWAISQAQLGTQFSEIADSQQAATLIGLLRGKGVTATEYYETALGLQPTGSYAEALNLLRQASRLHSDPASRASILRLEAQIYYQLGDVRAAKGADTLAEHAYNNSPDVAASYRDYNVAVTELFDAYYQIKLGCSGGITELTAAINELANSHIDPNPLPPTSSLQSRALAFTKAAGPVTYGEYQDDEAQLKHYHCQAGLAA